MLEMYVKKILVAKVYEITQETSLVVAPILSNELNNKILFKLENEHSVYSFKIRGAYNKIANLTDTQKKQGIVTASAGNHAQGVAISAQKLGINATIVMPVTTPALKIQGVRKYGGNVVLYGDSFPEALQYSLNLVDEHNLVYIHPYDDDLVIAGQGTVAMEILKQYNDNIDALFVPVGGGGLIAGVCAYIKYLKPEIKIIGVEPEDSNCLYQALQANKRIVLPKVGLFADGVAVSQIGEKPFELCKSYVDEVICISIDEICAAIKDIYNEVRKVTEPAGALALAGIKKYIHENNVTNKTFIAINSGANINFDRLKHVVERAEIGEQKEALLAITLQESPGSFKHLCKLLGKRHITEFNYRFHSKALPAYVFAGVHLEKFRGDTRENLIQYLSQHIQVLDLTDNELAKLHLRHTVGGRADVSFERVFRFEFPERPGALLDFLQTLKNNWNITLFHYRNHGAAYGRVFAGITTSENEHNELTQSLNTLGYPFWEETDNPAYQLFLTR